MTNVRVSRAALLACVSRVTGVRLPLADSLTHLRHCATKGLLHAQHDAVGAAFIDMFESVNFGYAWEQEVTLVSADVAADADADGNHALDAHDDDGDDHGDEAAGDATEAVVPKVKTWRSDVAGVGPEGKPMVFDFTVVNLAASSYRSKLKTKKNRVLRILKAAEDAKVKEGGRAALRAEALGADLVVLALSSNGAMSERTSDFFGRVVRHARKEGLEDVFIALRTRGRVLTTTGL